MNISESDLRTLVNMHAESICRVENVARKELTCLTSFVRRMMGLNIENDKERTTQIRKAT